MDSPEIVPAGAAAGSVPFESQREGDHDLPETQEQAEQQGPDQAWTFWDQQIKSGLVGERRWRNEGDQCEKLYFGEDNDPGTGRGTDNAKDNRITDKEALIHGNIDVLKPLVYSETPNPIVRRRFRGDGRMDETDLMAAEAGQRLGQYILDTECFDDVMELVRDDWLIVGRGAARAYYTTSFDAVGNKVGERVYPSYIEWQRLVLAPSSAWKALPWMAMEVHMTRTQVRKRFGEEKAAKMAFNHLGMVMTDRAKSDEDQERDAGGFGADSESGERPNTPFDTAPVWEIWNREEGKVVWFSPAYTGGLLDEIEDPLMLEGFWPMPKPLLATVKGEQMNPRPDIKYYERRAGEIEIATSKMKVILDAISVSGLFPGAMADEVAKLLSGQNMMIPVESWMALMEKGGTNNIIQWLPLQQMMAAVQALITLREQSKQAMFEASGISDIMRAQGDPNETATAQQLKGRYAGHRLKEKQGRMAKYARDMLRILLELGLEHFDTQTIADITGLDLPLTEAERQVRLREQQVVQQQFEADMAAYQQLEQVGQSLQDAGLPVGPMQPPKEPEFERISGTSWELVHDRLRTDYGRKISVTIETDSTILADEQEDKEARIEFLSAFTKMVAELMPLAGSGVFDGKTIKELLMFGLRGFPKSRTLETLIAELPDEPQGEPPEDTQVTVAKIKAEVDRAIQEMRMNDSQADREHEQKMKGVDLMAEAAKTAGQPDQPPQGANA